MTPNDHTSAGDIVRVGPRGRGVARSCAQSVRSVVLRLAGACLCAALLVGCGPDNEARFEATIQGVEGAECASGEFPFEPSLFAVTRTSTGALFRMQADSRERVRANAFYITVNTEHEVVQGCPSVDELSGASVQVGPDSCATAFFRFNENCARDFINPHVVGTVTFTDVGFGNGDMVEGTVSGQLVDFKSAEVGGEMLSTSTPLGTVDGTFRFEVEVGPAYQLFGTPSGPVANP